MNNKISLIFLATVIIIGASFLGLTIGQARFVDLSIYGLVALGALYLCYLYKFTWQIALFLISSGVQLNYGFRLSSQQYAAALLVVYGVLILFLRSNPYSRPEFFRRVHASRLMWFTGFLLAFGICSFAINWVIPYDGGTYALKNMLKAYSNTFAPVVILFLALLFPYSFRVGNRVVPTILSILLISLMLNFANTYYLFRQGYGGASILAEEEGAIGLLYIPIINASIGVFTMRVLAPMAVIFSFAFLCQRGWFPRQSNYLKVVTLSVLGLGLLGSMVSGGRAAVLLSIMYVGVVSLVNRRIVLMAAAACIAAMIVLIANIFSGFINKDLPVYVARPLQYVMIEKGDAMDSIEHSSDYRSELFSEAISEWQEDARVMLLGRSVYQAMNYAALKGIVGDKESFVMVNLNSGTCHALLPSVLIQYGIVGCVLYYAVYFMLIRFFWKSYKAARSEIYSEELRMISFLMAISTSIGILIATIGGSWFGALQVVMIILIKSMAARDELAFQRSQASQKSVEENSAIAAVPAWSA